MAMKPSKKPSPSKPVNTEEAMKACLVIEAVLDDYAERFGPEMAEAEIDALLFGPKEAADRFMRKVANNVSAC